MATTANTHGIPGSMQRAMAGAVAQGPLPADQTIEVTVRLRPAPGQPAIDPHTTGADGDLADRQYLSREQFAKAHGASAADIAKVEAFAHQHKLVVVSANAGQCRVVLAGPVSAINQAFGVELQEYSYPDGTYQSHDGAVSVPAELAGVVVGVFGLDDRAIAKPKLQRLGFDAMVQPASTSSSNTSYTPPQLAQLYNFPTGLDGTGQCIGIIELGGGTRPRDIQTYFTELGLPVPTVKTISVDHGKNRPTTADSADGEVMLDIEVAGAIAPKALIAVYFAPNTDRGFLDAVTAAVHDKVNKPSVISISWGAAESEWSDQTMTAFEQVFTDAAAMGVTICCAAGDNGSSDGVSDGQPHVDFPASAPHALACGGTRIQTDAGGITTEVVWNEGPNSATGGGYSAFFQRPDYQAELGAGVTTRGVPDVSGDADPASGYRVRVDGSELVFGGTSAVAPLWAGLIALMNQNLAQPVGFLNPLLYGPLQGKQVTRDITIGNNGQQEAGPGWDACTGWGSPDGENLLQALRGEA